MLALLEALLPCFTMADEFRFQTVMIMLNYVSRQAPRLVNQHGVKHLSTGIYIYIVDLTRYEG